jgi:hypothetical protein
MGATGQRFDSLMLLHSSLQATYCAAMQAQLAAQPSQPIAGLFFKKVGPCRYRHSNTGTYYALAKRGGKQFRKSLKTSDRQLAEHSQSG